jgi:hypothetical protein
LQQLKDAKKLHSPDITLFKKGKIAKLDKRNLKKIEAEYAQFTRIFQNILREKPEHALASESLREKIKANAGHRTDLRAPQRKVAYLSAAHFVLRNYAGYSPTKS